MTGLLGEVDLPAPIGDRWFEDYVPGSVFEFGYASVSETQIVAFARDYDPQSIHADPAWSATGPFGGLIACGVHTIAVCMRLYVDHYISQVGSRPVGWCSSFACFSAMSLIMPSSRRALGSPSGRVRPGVVRWVRAV